MTNIKVGPNFFIATETADIEAIPGISANSTAEILGISDDGVFQVWTADGGVFNSLTILQAYRGYQLTCKQAFNLNGVLPNILNAITENSLIVCDGNSLTAGGYGGLTYPQLLAATLPMATNGTQVINKGVGGQQTSQMIADATTEIDSLYEEDRTCILIAWEVGNDIYFNNDVAAAQIRFAEYCNARRAIGWKVIAITCTPRISFTDAGQQATYESRLQQANTWMLDNYSSFCDAIVNARQDARLQTVSSTYWNPDNIHLKQSGYEVLMTGIIEAISNLGQAKTPLFVYTGESNSGGYALNSEAFPAELLARPSVQILNNDTLEFEDLHIGVNNKLGHYGHEASWYTTHGWELGLANRVEANTSFDSPVYLVKACMGGSQINDWVDGGAGNYGTGTVHPWELFQERVNAAISLLQGQGKTVQLYIFYSQGINDAIAGTNINTWKTATLAHFDKIRAMYGPVTIVMTKFMSIYAAFNTAIDQLITARPDLYAVNTTDATTRDTNHWDYAGMKLIGQRMENVLIENYF